jgi:hypothetical protein
MALIDEVKPYTKSSPQRLEAMIGALGWVDGLDIQGDIVECGVWRGGNIILARKASPERVCWLYDTFEGMTEPGPLDVKKSGYAAAISYKTKKAKGKAWDKVTLDDARANFAATDTLDEDKLRFVVGPVEQTLLDPANLPERIAVLRLDTDWYESTKAEMAALYPRLAPGGILIVDDYGHWMGAQRAVKEYFGGNAPDMTSIDYTAVSFIKPAR